jgi:hypothetical protein
MAIKLVSFDLASGGDVLINREQVGAVLPKSDGGSIIRVVGRTEDIVVMEEMSDVWSALERELPEPRHPDLPH